MYGVLIFVALQYFENITNVPKILLGYPPDIYLITIKKLFLKIVKIFCLKYFQNISTIVILFSIY